MQILWILTAIYLLAGLYYSIDKIAKGISPLSSIFINTLLGPPFYLYIYYRYMIKKELLRKNIKLNNILERKKAVIFDIDGTIVDTEEVWREAFETVFGRHTQRVFLDDYFGKIGEALHEKWASVKARDVLDKTVTVKQLCDETYAQFLETLKDAELESKYGFVEMIAKLKETNRKVAITTNTKKEIAEAILDSIEVNPKAFDVVIYGDQVKHPKPNPEIYNKALGSLHLSKKDVLVFEDSVSGTTASCRAGIDTIAIWNPDKAKEEDYPSEVLLFATDFTGMYTYLSTDRKKLFGDMQKDYRKKMDAENTTQ